MRGSSPLLVTYWTKDVWRSGSTVDAGPGEDSAASHWEPVVPAAGKVDCEVLKGNPIAPHCIHSGQFLSSRSETHTIPGFESLRRVWSRQSLRCAATWCFLSMRLRVCMCMHKWRQEVDDRCISRSLPTFFFLILRQDLSLNLVLIASLAANKPQSSPVSAFSIVES